METMEFSHRLYQLRRARGLSQEDLESVEALKIPQALEALQSLEPAGVAARSLSSAILTVPQPGNTAPHPRFPGTSSSSSGPGNSRPGCPGRR